MFPSIRLYRDDTLASVQARLAKAIISNSKQPGIKPIYTLNSVKQEASRLLSEVPSLDSKT